MKTSIIQLVVLLAVLPSVINKAIHECALAKTQAIIDEDIQRREDGIDISVTEKTFGIDLLHGEDIDIIGLVNPAMYFNYLTECRATDPSTWPKLNKKGGRLYECPYELSSPCPKTAMMYRRSDGSCNNVDHPLWGSSRIPFIRRMDPQYEKGGVGVRVTGENNVKLPSPRLVSTAVHTSTGEGATAPVTSLYTGFGQLISHDITSAAFASGDKGYGTNCLGRKHETKCANFKIPEDDPFYINNNRTIHRYTRSAEATDLYCKHGVRQQLNLITSFLDGSTVYGDNDVDSLELREPGTGFLKSSTEELYPIKAHPNKIAIQKGISAFFGGNKKLNEASQIFGAGLLFHRAHNRFAKVLSELNTAWDGERVFQETRRIIIAIIQHITYNEWVPATISDELMTKYDLKPQQSDYFSDYDAAIDPTLWNVVGTAVLRFGHSMLNNEHHYADRNYDVDKEKTLPMVYEYFRPLRHVVRNMDIQRGQLVRSSEKCDRAFVRNMQHRLFEPSKGNGLDIVSMNLQRGRDHGLPPYAAWRNEFELTAPTDSTAKSFPDHSDEDRILLNEVYNSVLDIDLYSAGVSEKPVAGKTIGPLFANILAAQFERVKKGDRFWYETNATPQRFTTDQLGEIRIVTMSKILCLVNDINNIQRNAFHIYDDETNPRVDCSDLEAINLSKWKE